MLVEPYTYLATVPGKEVRSALIAAFNEWMHVPEEDLTVVKKLVGMLHTASLLCVVSRLLPFLALPDTTVGKADGGMYSTAWMMLKTTLTSVEGCLVRSRLGVESRALSSSQPRRTVAHKIYGIPQTINSANYVYFLAYQELQRIRPREGVKVEEMVTGAFASPFRKEVGDGWLTSLSGCRGAVEPAPRTRDGSVLEGELDLPY